MISTSLHYEFLDLIEALIMLSIPQEWLIYKQNVLSLCYCSATPSRKYSSRSNAGDVVFTFGNVKGVTWKTSRSNQAAMIKHYNPEAIITEKFKYMFQKLSDKAAGNLYF